ALDAGTSVQRVDIRKLQAKLLEDGQILEWTGPRNGSAATPAIDPKSLRGVVVDDADARKTGNWLASVLTSVRRIGTGYIHDGNTDKGKLQIAFVPDIPAPDTYSILLHYPPNPNRATNVPVTIEVEGVGASTVRVNQQETGPEGCISLGSYKLPKGKRTTVTLSNAGTDGYVVADAVQFVPQGEPPAGG
ncbi:MAG TPA: xanthan lyase, partial [Armatimonadota bacterium]|nr:xanthan lyase [Armatimonadota bacterium]